MGAELIIPVSDIFYILEISKALKQRTIMWYQDYVIGMDSDDYIIYYKIDSTKINVRPIVGLIVNQRELSAFTKTITTEFEFKIDIIAINFSTLLTTLNGTLKVDVNTSFINNKMMFIGFNNRFINSKEDDMSNIIDFMYSMNKSSGVRLFKYDDNHILTLFGGLLPLTKSDKIFLSIIDDINETFLARFRIKKKLGDVIIILKYMKI